MTDREPSIPAEERQYNRIRVCTNFRAGDLLPSCAARGSKDLAEALRHEIALRGDFIRFETVHCLGKCHIGPTIKLLPGGPFLQGAQASDAAHIADLLLAERYDEAVAAFSAPGED